MKVDIYRNQRLTLLNSLLQPFRKYLMREIGDLAKAGSRVDGSAAGGETIVMRSAGVDLLIATAFALREALREAVRVLAQFSWRLHAWSPGP